MPEKCEVLSCGMQAFLQAFLLQMGWSFGQSCGGQWNVQLPSMGLWSLRYLREDCPAATSTGIFLCSYKPSNVQEQASNDCTGKAHQAIHGEAHVWPWKRCSPQAFELGILELTHTTGWAGSASTLGIIYNIINWDKFDSGLKFVPSHMTIKRPSSTLVLQPRGTWLTASKETKIMRNSLHR